MTESSHNQEIDLTIERLGINGEGVGRYEGLTLFVDGALPGEKVRARIYDRRKTFARANVIKFFNRSTHRVQPPCPLFGTCGGCQLMHLDYPQQLEAKRMRVVDAMQRIAKIDVEVMPCIPSPQPLAYRNKIQLPVGSNNRLGLYARNTHDLVEIEECGIHCALGERALGHVQSILKNSPQTSDLKHVLIKTAVRRDEVLVVLVTKTQESPMEIANQILRAMPEIRGVVQNINPQTNNVILGPHFRTLAGQGWIEEELCGLLFKVSPASFFQVNPMQAEALYQKVLELACLTGSEHVLDAYCGVGTLSLLVARSAREVTGIEYVADAINDAKENAQRNQIENANFLCGLAEEKVAALDQIAIAILNPPRKGCERSFLEALCKKAPHRIVYVSCDPATLARDLQILTQQGYRVDIVQPFDMFPQTMHVECVVSLSLF